MTDVAFLLAVAAFFAIALAAVAACDRIASPGSPDVPQADPPEPAAT